MARSPGVCVVRFASPGTSDAAPLVDEPERDPVGASASPRSSAIGTSVDELARIHLPVRIPDVLVLAERLNEVGPEHLGQEIAAPLTAAVLAR